MIKIKNVIFNSLINRRTIIFFVLTVLLYLLVYLPSLKNGFVMDDRLHIEENNFIKSSENFIKVFTSNYFTNRLDMAKHYLDGVGSGEGSYRPVVTITYFLDYVLWGDNPFGFHLTNMLIHFLNGFILYFLLLIIFQSKIISFISTLFFLLHPISSETISVINYRDDLLALGFYLLSYVLFIYYMQFGSKRKLCYLGSLFCFSLALFSKESALMLPLMLIVHKFIIGFDRNLRIKKFLLIIMPFFSLIIFYFGISTWFMFQRSDAYFNMVYLTPRYIQGSLYVQLLTTFNVISYYLKTILFPLPFSFDLPDSTFIINNILEKFIIIKIVFILSLFLLLFKFSSRNKFFSYSLSWFVINILPIFCFTLLWEDRAFVILSRVYLIVAMISLVVGVFLKLCFKKKIIIFPLAILILVYFCFLSRARVGVFKNDITIFEKRLAACPQSLVDRMRLAHAYYKENDYCAAIENLQYAKSIRPNFYYIYHKNALVYKDMNNYIKAKIEAQKALSLNPESLITKKLLLEIESKISEKN